MTGSTPVTRACPTCGRPTVDAYRPFCSPRCADADLHRWLSGSYVIPGADEAGDEDTPPAPPPRGSRRDDD